MPVSVVKRKIENIKRAPFKGMRREYNDRNYERKCNRKANETSH